MKKKKQALLLIGCLLAASAPGAESTSKTQALKSFTSADSPISKQLTLDEDKAWLAECEKATTLRLFEVGEPNVDDCMVIYRVKLKTEGLKAPAYLEMWCRLPGRGEFFSRGLQNTVTGSNDWASYETPFFLKKGEKPDLIKLNIVLKGSGKIWVKDVELIKGPLPKQ
jgi:hypothetical protein